MKKAVRESFSRAAKSLLGAGQKKLDIQLFTAAMNGNSERCRDLIERGADVNARDRGGWTPLHKAASRGHTETTTSLIECRADVNARDKEGRTALHRVANLGITRMAAVLMRHGADVNARDKGGLAAREWAQVAGAHGEAVAWAIHEEISARHARKVKEAYLRQRKEARP